MFAKNELKNLIFGLNDLDFVAEFCINFIIPRKLMHTLCLPRHQPIETDTILFLASEINYTRVYTISQSQIITALTLGLVFSKLDTRSFIRVNRSHIINLSHFSNYRYENKKFIIQLASGQEFIASRRRLKKFESLFKHSLKDLSW